MTRKLRPTRSRDLIMRATVRVEFRVSYEMLLDCIAEAQPWAGVGGNDPTFPDWPADVVLTKVREALTATGDHVRTGLYGELDEDSAAWCRRMAAKVWPDEHTP